MKNKIIVIHPVLTEEERKIRMQKIKEATMVFLAEAESEKRRK